MAAGDACRVTLLDLHHVVHIHQWEYRFDVVVVHTDAPVRDGLADGCGVVGAVDADVRRRQPKPARAERAAGVHRFVDDDKMAGGRRGFGRADSHGIDMHKPAAKIQRQLPRAGAHRNGIDICQNNHLTTSV